MRATFWAGVVYALAATAFVLAALETTTRVYSWLAFPKMMQIDPELGWAHSPNRKKIFETEGQRALIVHNELGHRGRNPGTAPVPGRKRILVLGDSFTEGANVNEEELFTALMEAIQTDLDVINAGVGGYGTVQEYLYLTRRGLKLAPDLVLLMFYENDLTDNCMSFYATIGPRPYGSIENGQLIIHESPSPKEFLRYVLPVPYAEFLNRHSLAYNFLNARLYQPLRASYLQALELDAFRRAEACPQRQIFMAVVKRMQTATEQSAAAFAMALIPSREAVASRSSGDHEALLSFCAESGIACMSLLPAMAAAAGKGAKPCFTVDIHWTRDGHRVAAEALSPFVAQRLAASR